MRTLCVSVVFFTGLLAQLASAQDYRVSQLKYDNFKTYDTYNISVDDIRAVLIDFTKESPVFDESGLFILAARLAEIYRAKGLAFHRVEVVKGNPTRLVLVPGRVSDIDIRGNERYSDKQLSRYFSELKGQLVDSQTISAAMTRLNKLPGLQGFSFLSYGTGSGDAVLNVNIAKESWGEVTTEANNHGTASTGDYRVNSQLTLNNPLKLKDQWRVGGTLNENLDNWSSNLAVDIHARNGLIWGLNGTYQAMALTEEFELLNLSGWQATANASVSGSPVQNLRSTVSWSIDAGFLTQSLDNEANIEFFDVAVEDAYGSFSLSADLAGNRQFFGVQLETKAGYLLKNESLVALDDDTWVLNQGELSFARSITRSVLQQGIDATLAVKGQYAWQPLPSHRRFGLAGPGKLGAFDNGSISHDTAILGELGLRLLNFQTGPIQWVVQAQGASGWGQTNDVETDLLNSLGGELDIFLGPASVEVKAFTDETFEPLQIWFSVALTWPKGR